MANQNFKKLHGGVLLASTLLMCGLPLSAKVFGPGEKQPYIYDYYQGVDAADYLAAYQGSPFKAHIVTGEDILKIEAEDFDKGPEGSVWAFKQKTPNDYRPGEGDVPKINNGNGGKVIGNISAGDFLCFTIDVKKAGEYRITCKGSCDVNRSFHFEVDGNSAGAPVSFFGMGWDNYMDLPMEGLHLSEGKHVIRWIPENSMNLDSFTLERIGEYDAAQVGTPSFNYPREDVYTHNPLFVNWDSPMFGSTFKTNLWTADPSAHVFKDPATGKDRLYVYASHDMAPAQGCDRMDRYHVFSTDDMIHWTDHGEIMNASTSNAYTGTAGDGFMWAPDCAYNPNDGKYYFVYPHKINVDPATTDIRDMQNPESTIRWAHFLAVSENPDGPFECIGYIKGIPSTIDPCLFVDDDSEAYIFTSGQGHGGWGAKLKRDNWLELDGEMTPMAGEGGDEKAGFDDFHEAPYMIKRNGIYYLLHSDNNSLNNRLRYSTAQNPLGPFTKKGIFMNAHGHDTHHNSLVEFNGKWYSFYHTGDFSAAGNLRSVCYDEVIFDADGNIEVVNTWGKAHGEIPVISTSEPTIIKANSFNDGLTPERTNGSGYFKRNEDLSHEAESIILDNEEWARYTVNVKEGARYAVAIHGKVLSGKPKVVVSSNGEWRTNMNGVEFSGDELYLYPVNLPEGEQYIELRVKGGTLSIDDFEIDLGQVNIPGVIEAEDLDATDYSFKQQDQVKHSYRDDVDVAISTGNGVTRIGNTSTGDYFTYTFNVTEEGRYAVTSRVSVGENKGGYTLTFYKDGEEPQTFSETFEAVIPEGKTNGWDSYIDVITSKIKLTEGVWKMRFTVDRGLNIDKFTFTRTGGVPVPVDPSKAKIDIPGKFLGGDIDSEGYYNKQFVAEGANLKNDYKNNPDVDVRINGNGVIGNTSKDDFFTYYFNALTDDEYKLKFYAEASTGNKGKITLLFDDEDLLNVEFMGEGWGKTVETDCGTIALSKGAHRMLCTVINGLNIGAFEFISTHGVENGVEAICTELPTEVNVYTLQGTLLKMGVSRENALEGLEKGIYIVSGVKMVK